MEQENNKALDYYPFDVETCDRRKSPRFQFSSFCQLHIRPSKTSVFARTQNIDRGGVQVMLDAELGPVPFYVDLAIPLINHRGELNMEGYIDVAPDVCDSGYIYRVKFININDEQYAALDTLFETLTAIGDRREQQRARGAVNINSAGYRHFRHKTKVQSNRDRRKGDRRRINQSVAGVDRRVSDRRVKARRETETRIEYVDWTVRPSLKTSAEKLLQFYRKANFIYRNKLDFLLPVKDDVICTIDRLLNCTDNTCQYVFVMHGDDIKGSVMAVRYTNDAWMVQHMVTLPGQGILSRELMLEILAWSIKNKKMKNYVTYFQNKTRWAHKTFHTAEETYGGGGMLIEEYDYVLQKTDEWVPVRTEGLRAEELRPGDYGVVYPLLLQANNPLSLNGIGITTSGCGVEEAGKAYASIGLTRDRACFVVKDKGAFLGFGYVDISSYGISLSLIMNTFYVFCFDAARKQQIYAALINRINEELRARSKVYSIGLVRSDEKAMFEAMGYKYGRTYARYNVAREKFDESFKFLNSGRKLDAPKESV